MFRKGCEMNQIEKRKIWIIAIIMVLLFTIIVLLGGGWFVSMRIKQGVLEPERTSQPFDLEVVDLKDDRITLRVTPQTKNAEWKSEGIWGLRWNGGYAQVGEILSRNDQHVVRTFVPMMKNLKPGDRVRLDGFPFPDDPLKSFNLPTKKIFFNSPLGEFAAFYLDGSQSIWVIFVHGKRDPPPRNPLRAYPILPLVCKLGFPSLIITYRNDIGTLANPDGYHWYGLTEWKDLEGAATYALEHGAEKLILVGYSMGGAIVMNFLHLSPLKGDVIGVILDSPMLDLSATIDHGARQIGFPSIFTSLGKLTAGIRFKIDWKALNYLGRANELTVPILLFHGHADRTIPVETSDALAKARPDIVRYHRIHGATHIRSWNMNPTTYEETVSEFLKYLMAVKMM